MLNGIITVKSKPLTQSVTDLSFRAVRRELLVFDDGFGLVTATGQLSPVVLLLHPPGVAKDDIQRTAANLSLADVPTHFKGSWIVPRERITSLRLTTAVRPIHTIGSMDLRFRVDKSVDRLIAYEFEQRKYNVKSDTETALKLLQHVLPSTIRDDRLKK